ncbi:MAG: hypothetical protein K8R53_15730 [Bacteroidales bacterium]|nr:hypothetical protein [Bacteroidales bacterium]
MNGLEQLANPSSARLEMDEILSVAALSQDDRSPYAFCLLSFVVRPLPHSTTIFLFVKYLSSRKLMK